MTPPEPSLQAATTPSWDASQPTDPAWVLGPTPQGEQPLLGELGRVAVELAATAAHYAHDAWSRERTHIETKSSSTDMVSEVDKGSERLIVSIIDRLRPEDGILGEEGASRPSATGVRWIVDPVDGTTNYLFGIDNWSISVAAELQGEIVAGVVAAPARGEIFGAVAGRPARRNGLPISVDPERRDLGDALVATGFSYDRQRRALQGQAVAQLVPQVRDIRRFGSAALDLSSVAMGRVDAYYELGLNPWDLAAGELIVRQAGGRVVSTPGGAVMASNPGIFDPLLALLEEVGSPGFG